MMFSDDFKNNYIRSVSDGFLYLTLLPTEKCNFRCTYCYEDFKIGKMSEDTIEGIKNLLTKAAPTLKNLQVAWFGGEPTLNRKAIVDISSHIIKLQAEFNFVYSSHMTTNGYFLNSEMLSELVKFGINGYQISLDGEKDCHDKTRLQANGQGSFDVIWSNLKSYKALNKAFGVKLRLHITLQNTQSMLKLCQKIKSEFGKDPRFTTMIEDIKKLGRGIDSSDAEAYVAKDAKRRVEEIKALMSDSIDIQEKEKKQANSYICYAAMPRQLMIRANGIIGKCTVMLNDDRNNLGKINRDGDYEVDGNKFEIWTRGFINLNKGNLGCPANKLPKLNKFNRGIQIVEVA